MSEALRLAVSELGYMMRKRESIGFCGAQRLSQRPKWQVFGGVEEAARCRRHASGRKQQSLKPGAPDALCEHTKIGKYASIRQPGGSITQCQGCMMDPGFTVPPLNVLIHISHLRYSRTSWKSFPGDNDIPSGLRHCLGISSKMSSRDIFGLANMVLLASLTMLIFAQHPLVIQDLDIHVTQTRTRAAVKGYVNSHACLQAHANAVIPNPESDHHTNTQDSSIHNITRPSRPRLLNPS